MQRARPEQFRAARAFINRLGAPVLAIPGNHDIPLLALGVRLFDPYGRHCAAFGDTLEPMHTSSDLLVLCVNTTRWWRHKNGEVSELPLPTSPKKLGLLCTLTYGLFNGEILGCVQSGK